MQTSRRLNDSKGEIRTVRERQIIKMETVGDEAWGREQSRVNHKDEEKDVKSQGNEGRAW